MVWVAAGLAAAGAASSFLGGQSAKKAAKKAGKLNYEAIMAETAENIRRAELEQDQVYGATVAGIGGSGARGGSGTPANYLSAMQTEFDTQNQWQLEAGRRRAEIAKQTGQDTGSQAAFGGASSAFSQASNIFTNQWWNNSNTTGGA